MKVEFVEYLGEGQALLQLPENMSIGPAAIGGKIAINNLLYCIVDAHVRTRQIIAGPILDAPPPKVVEPEPVYDGPILHEWKKDEDGDVEYFELGSYHDGPQCVRCGEIFCRHCNPEKLKEPCEEQTPYLF